MTIDIHYNYNKLSIDGVAKWRRGNLHREREQFGNLGLQKHNTQTLHHNIYIVSLAGGRENKQKHNTQTLHHNIYIIIIVIINIEIIIIVIIIIIIIIMEQSCEMSRI